LFAPVVSSMSTHNKAPETEAQRRSLPVTSVPTDVQAKWTVDEIARARKEAHVAAVCVGELSSSKRSVYERRARGGLLFLSDRAAVSARAATAEEASAAQAQSGTAELERLFASARAN